MVARTRMPPAALREAACAKPVEPVWGTTPVAWEPGGRRPCHTAFSASWVRQLAAPCMHGCLPLRRLLPAKLSPSQLLAAWAGERACPASRAHSRFCWNCDGTCAPRHACCSCDRICSTRYFMTGCPCAVFLRSTLPLAARCFASAASLAARSSRAFCAASRAAASAACRGDRGACMRA